MNEIQLQLILEYEMTKEESLAFRLSLLYLDIAKKYFPDFPHPNYGAGDPRKKELFKHCWKLLNDTKDKLNNEEYQYYIRAQMSILKNIKLPNGKHPYIHPNILTGDKAWNRWLVWKKYFDSTKDKTSHENIDEFKIVKQSLSETHYALKVRLGEINENAIIQSLKNSFIFRLVGLKVVSPYFVLLSPIVQEYIAKNKINLKSLGINAESYPITPEIQDYYKSLFGGV